MADEENQLPPPDNTPVETDETLVQESFFDKYKWWIFLIINILVLAAIAVVVYIFIIKPPKSTTPITTTNTSSDNNITTTTTADGEEGIDSTGAGENLDSGDGWMAVEGSGDQVADSSGGGVAGSAASDVVGGVAGGDVVATSSSGVAAGNGIVLDGGGEIAPVDNVSTLQGGSLEDSSFTFEGQVPTVITAVSPTLTRDSNYSDQKIYFRVATPNFALAKFILKGSTQKDITYSSGKLALKFNGSFDASDLSAVAVVVKNSAGAVISNTPVNLSQNSLSVNTINWNVKLPKNTYNTVEVVATVRGNISDGKLETDTVKTALVFKNETITTSAFGPLITAVKSNNTITASFDSGAAENNKNGLVAVSDSLEAAKFKLTTKNDKFKINALTLTFKGKNDALNLIKIVALKNNGEVINRVDVKAGATEVVMNTPNLNLAADSSITVAVFYSINSAAINEKTVGTDLAVGIYSINATDSDGVHHEIYTGARGSSLLVYKSVPVITNGVLPATKLVKNTNTFAVTKINSKMSGMLSWKKLVYTLSGTVGFFTPGTNLESPQYDRNGVYYLNLLGGPGVVAGEEAEYPLINKFKLYRKNADSSLTEVPGSFSFIHYQDRVKVIFTATQEQKLSSLTEYVLKGNVVVDVKSTNSVATKIVMESTSLRSDIFPVVGALTGTGNFVWSDLSSAAHSETSKDWHNEILLKELPTTAQVLNYN